MKKLLAKTIMAVILLGSLTLLAQAQEEVKSEKWVLTLSGSGSTILDGGTAVGGELGVGRTGKILLPVEGGLRQSAGYVSDTDNAVFNTKVYLDVFPVKFKAFEAGAGVNFGTTWGNTPIVYSFAPEGVVRWWLNDKAGLFGRVELPLDLGNNNIGDRLSYFVGVIVRF